MSFRNWLDGGSTVEHRWAALLLIVVCLALYLPGFASLPPTDRDEARFAQASKQMIETGNVVDIRFQAMARNKKPVGIYWLQAAAVRTVELLGVADARRRMWPYRLPSLLGAIGVVLGTYWAALALTTRRAALLAALLIASTVLLTAEAHLATTDAVNAATTVLAMGVLARAWVASAQRDTERPAPLSIGTAAVFWTAIGIGILVKGPITPLVATFAALTLAAKRRSGRWLLTLRLRTGALLTLTLVLPWLVLMAFRTKDAFFAEAIGREILGKVTAVKEFHGAPPGSYAAVFWITAWPMAPFVALAAPAAWRDRHTDQVAFLLAWIVPAWIMFECMPTKLPHYVLPLTPGLAILAASVLERAELRSWQRPKSLFGVVATAFAVLPVVIFAILIFGRGLLWTTLSVGTLVSSVLTCTILFGFAVFAARLVVRRNVAQAMMLTPAMAFVVNLFLLGFLLTPEISDLADLSPRLAEAGMAALAGTCDRPAYASASDYEPSLVFVTQTDLLETDGPGAAVFIKSAPCRVAFITRDAEPSFAAGVADLNNVHLASRVLGTDVNGGKTLDIAVYVRQGERP